jgi:DnaJ-class molecular chaperone
MPPNYVTCPECSGTGWDNDQQLHICWKCLGKKVINIGDPEEPKEDKKQKRKDRDNDWEYR